MMRLSLSVVACLLVVSCGTPRSSVSEDAGLAADPAANWPPAVIADDLEDAGEPLDLEIGVVVFDDGVDNPDSRDARDKLRSVEARLVAATLRDTLTESEMWGPVRVLPVASQFAALTITGALVHSDGRDLVVDVRAVDANDRVWLDQRFHATASARDYQTPATPIFRPLFVAIANQLLARARALDARDLSRLEATARLRYAAELAPEAFGAYLGQNDGLTVLQRLPADDDPMLARIDRIRNQEALFIDTVDEQYVSLREALGPTYRLWRQSSLEQADYLEQYRERAAERELRAQQGSFAAMQQVYSTYRSLRIQEQDLFDLATGFDNETAPTVMQSGDRVVRLSGTLEQQYLEWRDILARIIRLERGDTL